MYPYCIPSIPEEMRMLFLVLSLFHILWKSVKGHFSFLLEPQSKMTRGEQFFSEGVRPNGKMAQKMTILKNGLKTHPNWMILFVTAVKP